MGAGAPPQSSAEPSGGSRSTLSALEGLQESPLQAPAASAAASAVAAGGATATNKGIASALVTFTRVLLSTPSKAASANPSNKVVGDLEAVGYGISEDEAFAALSTSFQQFDWTPRLDAIRKLLKHCVDKKTRGAAAMGPRILHLSLQQIAGTASAATADLHSSSVQKTLKGVLLAALNAQASLMEVGLSLIFSPLLM